MGISEQLSFLILTLWSYIMLLNRSMEIHYQWFTEQIENKELTSEQIEALEEHAFFRIMEMAKEGFIEGELNTFLTICNEEVEIKGWWKLKK